MKRRSNGGRKSPPLPNIALPWGEIRVSIYRTSRHPGEKSGLVLRAIPTRRRHDQPWQLTEARVRQIDRAIFGDDSIASALVRRHLRNQAEFSGGVNAGDREPRVPGSAHIKGVRGRRIREVVDAVAGIDRR